MALSDIELITSRKSSLRNKGSTVDFEFWLEGSSDHLTMLAYLESISPPTHSGLILTSIDVEPTEALGVWLGTVTYGDPDDSRNQERPETGDMEWSFSTVGTTAHIELGLQNNVPYTVPGGPAAPAVENVIGLTKSGNGVAVEGVDILVPRGRFSETHYLPGSTVTVAYFNTVQSLTGTTNQAAFRGFDIGEVLFAGANGTRRGRGDWAVTFDFETSKNKANFMVGQINVGWKPGHEWLWVMYEDAISAAQLIRKPLHAFVIPVYAPGDFSQLQIGTS